MRILFIFFALLFSSNSFASNQCKVLAIDANLVKTYNIDIKGLHVGSNFSPSDFTSTSNITNYGYCNLYITSRFGAKRFVKGTKAYKTCKLPQIMNETTGQCETPPDPNFCQSSKFLEIVASESNACAAKYPNHLTNFTQTCVDSKNYSFTCKQGLPKPDPDPDPDPDPKPPGGGGGNGGGGNGGGGNGGGGNGGGSGGSGGSGSGHGDVGINNRLDKLIALEGRSAIARESMQADTKNLISIGSNTYQEIQTGFSSTVGQLRTLGSMLGNGFSGLSSVVADGNNEIGNVDNSLIRNGDKLDAIKGQLVENGKGTKGIGDSLTSIDSKLDDLNDGSNTNAGSNGCGNNTFNCSGNDYECYMAKQSYLTACNIQSLASNNNGNDGDNSGGDGSGAKGAITKSGNDLIGSIRAYNSNNGNPSKLFDGEIALDSTLNKYDESNGFSFDSKCPVPNRVNYGLGTIEISYQPFCELALYIRAMLMLSASIASILMIAKFS